MSKFFAVVGDKRASYVPNTSLVKLSKDLGALGIRNC